jgi:putative ABC transport system ATP-binding protein
VQPDGTTHPPLLARRVVRRFPTAGGSVTALDDVDLDAPAGRLTVVAGPSGSGKSTLLAVAACADRADSGRVLVDGVDVQALSRSGRRGVRRHTVAFLLPTPSDNLLDRLDASANVRWSARRRSGLHLDEAATAAELAVVGLEDRVHLRVPELSGGEQQRLALVCVLVGGPRLVLADEPTASLDRASGALVVAALRRAADAGATLVVASHDPNVVAAADEVVRLDHGRRVA